jgi:hypothetical protein
MLIYYRPNLYSLVLSEITVCAKLGTCATDSSSLSYTNKIYIQKNII